MRSRTEVAKTPKENLSIMMENLQRAEAAALPRMAANDPDTDFPFGANAPAGAEPEPPKPEPIDLTTPRARAVLDRRAKGLPLDDNDRLVIGELPDDPETGTVLMVTPRDVIDAAAARQAKAAPKKDTARAPAPWSELISQVTPEWVSKAPPSRNWLLRDARRPNRDGVLPLGKVGAAVAEGGLGKTMLATQISLCESTGSVLFGALEVANGPGRVFMALGEEDVPEAQRRVFNGARSMRVKAPSPNMLVIQGLAGCPCAMIEVSRDRNPVDGEYLVWLRDWLRADVAKHGPYALLNLDPLSRFAGAAAEKDNAAGTRFVQALESLIEPSGGATILTWHHTNKISRGAGARVDTSSARGSSSLTDGFRWVATAGYESQIQAETPEARERLSEIVVIEFTKSNYSRKADPIRLRRDVDNGGALVPLDDVDLQIIAEARSKPATTRATATADKEAKKRDVADAAERKRAEATAKKRADEETALLDILREQHGLGFRQLRAAMANALGSCTDDRLIAIRARLGTAVNVVPGANSSQLHYAAEPTKEGARQ